MTAAENRNVCRELDDLALHMLELMDEQLQNNSKIKSTMKYGFIDIAKARYIMGNRSLSQLQLPSENSPEFNALSTVKLSPSENGTQRFILNTVSKIKPKDKPPATSELSSSRKRIEDGIDKSGESGKVVDPLKWFGVLVPQNLRRAQSGFTSAIELVTDSANTQLEIESTMQRYMELKEKKACPKPPLPAVSGRDSKRTDNSKKNKKNAKSTK